ncbi:MAG: hypothetical protein JXR12_06605 [Neptunomonas phycophila]|uniref:hypothetical protein n=1 Tax=Neptunomonas phycophila TaxID=1572645 RepID=UPI003B8C608C
MPWTEIDSREYLQKHRSYSSLKVNRDDADEMEYTFRGQPVLKATNMRGYPRYWKASANKPQPKVVHASREEASTSNHPKRTTTMAESTDQTKSKKDQAKDILLQMKQESTLNRATAIKKFVAELGVSDAYAATLWQGLKDSV